MNKISINLLPQTVLLERIQSSKLSLVNKLSIGVLVLVIILTVGVLLLRINQNRESSKMMDEVKVAEDKVLSFRNKEVAVYALKNRLDAISSKLGTDEKVKTMFNLIVYLTPPEVTLTDVSVDKNGSITASFNSKSLAGIDKLFLGLSNKETNMNLVSKVDLAGISLGKESTYRFSLRIAAVK
ncbi:MAG: hypothetical protein PHQ59_04445 [Candidatus Daviesbacteria bacterium]|nr:hypothetical protein [Candidatus Daviesbacteria bacterium]